MTAIAFDGHTLAADGLEVFDDGYVVNTKAVKLIQLDDHLWLGGAGKTENITYFVSKISNRKGFYDILVAHKDTKLLYDLVFHDMFDEEDVDFNGIVIDFKAKRSFWLLDTVCEQEYDKPIGTGTGGRFVIGAMVAGSNAIDAIRQTSVYNRSYNDQVHYVTQEEHDRIQWYSHISDKETIKK